MQKLTILGAFAALIYVMHVWIGGMLWDGYRHLHQPISDLTAQGAPDRVLMTSMTFLYGLLSIVFAASAYGFTKGFAPKISRIGMMLLLAMYLVSITYNLFPQDLPGAPVTFRGVMHFVVTGLIIPLTIVAPLLVGMGMRKIDGLRKYGNYSVATGIIIFIAGGTAAIFFANQLPFFGLVERINIGVLQLWMLVSSIKFYTMKPPNQSN